jgi:hypothetical protein
MSLVEAAAETPWGPDTLRKAIQTTGVDKDGQPTFPPPLVAGKAGKKYFILDTDLRAWLNEALRTWRA